jgi:hypothetical protein
MNTKVSISVSPKEFDLLREAVDIMCDLEHEKVNDVGADPKARQTARTREVMLRDLSHKLNS